MPLFSSYVFDTGTLIDLCWRKTPKPLFDDLHAKIDSLVEQGRIISSADVYEELVRGPKNDDKVLEWANNHKQIFIDIDPDQDQVLPKITKEFPSFIDYKIGRFNADPLLVAIAISKDMKVVTSERPSRDSKPHIPDVCKHFDIGCMDLYGFIEDNGWKIRLD